MSETNNAEVSAENTIDWEARAKKAEAKIVDMKTSQTETKTEEVKTEPVVDTPNYMTREDFEKEKFFEANAELSEHKEDIDKLVSKGYSLEDAKTVTLAKDPTIEARKNTQNSNFTAGTPDLTPSQITKEQLEKAEGLEYDKLMDLIDSGKSTLLK